MSETEFKIGQKFIGEYPPEAARWCNDSGIAYIEEITLDREEQRTFEIVANTPPTKEYQIKIYKNTTSQYIDKIAQTRDYDNAYACLSYLNSTNETWKRESVIFNEWRDNVWNKAYEIINKIENNEIIPLNINDFVSQLPLIDWNKNI